ncbi:MAG: hypothetical protein AAFY72_01975 [Cyanobacteria bacterium J06649_4]
MPARLTADLDAVCPETAIADAPNDLDNTPCLTPTCTSRADSTVAGTEGPVRKKSPEKLSIFGDGVTIPAAKLTVSTSETTLMPNCRKLRRAKRFTASIAGTESVDKAELVLEGAI